MRLSDLNLIFALYCVNIVFDHVLSKGKGHFLTFVFFKYKINPWFITSTLYVQCRTAQYFQEIPLSKVERK